MARDIPDELALRDHFKPDLVFVDATGHDLADAVELSVRTREGGLRVPTLIMGTKGRSVEFPPQTSQRNPWSRRRCSRTCAMRSEWRTPAADLLRPRKRLSRRPSAISRPPSAGGSTRSIRRSGMSHTSATTAYRTSRARRVLSFGAGGV
jgi:hypothetical protein